jgi:hypothetical protein
LRPVLSLLQDNFFFFENTIASALKSCIIKNIKENSKNIFDPEKVKKKQFIFRAKI